MSFSFAKKIRYWQSLFITLCLAGCGGDKEKNTEEMKEHPAFITENSHALVEKKLLTTSLQDRLLVKADRKHPSIGLKYIADHRTNDLTIYDKNTLDTIKVFYDISCEHSPVFMNDDTLLATTRDQVYSINLENMSLQSLVKLEGPLLSAPCLLEDGSIFVQYMNNITQCFDKNGRSLWKTVLPYSAASFKQTMYQPCADEQAIYLAYPGGALIRLQRDTGMIDWISPAILDQQTHKNAFSAVQLNAPLLQSDMMLFAQTSNNQCLCIDKRTGQLLNAIGMAQPASAYLDPTTERLFAITDLTTVSCYDTATLTKLWSHEALAPITFVGELRQHPSAVILCEKTGHLIALDSDSGELRLNRTIASLRDSEIFLESESLYSFNSYGTLTEVAIPQELLSS